MEQNFSKEQLELLNTPLTKAEIEVKEGIPYIASHAAIRKANTIFGPGNWGYHITSPFELQDTGKVTKNGSAIYRVRVQVTLEVRGCMPITDIGDCEANGLTAQAMSMAEKGAVSDGVKRCLRIFGPAFGLDLYDKDWRPESADHQQDSRVVNYPNGNGYSRNSTPAPASNGFVSGAGAGTTTLATEKQVKFIYATGRDQGFSDDQVVARCREKFGVPPEELTRARASQFIDMLKQPA